MESTQKSFAHNGEKGADASHHLEKCSLSVTAKETKLDPYSSNAEAPDAGDSSTIEVYVHTVNNEEKKVKREPMRFVEKDDVYPLARVFNIKKKEDLVEPLVQDALFSSEDMQNQDFVGIDKTLLRIINGFAEFVPASERMENFRQYNLWQAVPEALNHAFKTNLLDLDSVRFYEAFLTTSSNLWPASPAAADKCDVYNILFLCSPTGGAVTGSIMYMDINTPHLKPNWKVFTKQPWYEGNTLDNVILNDNALFWESEKWKYVFTEDMTICTADKVKEIICFAKSEFKTEKVDLVVADLSPSIVSMDDAGKELSDRIEDELEDNNPKHLMDVLKKAILTECAEIETSLRILNNGGNFVISLVNPTNVTSTLGNIAFLTGLFKTVDIVVPRLSSTWLRPVTLVCCGYVGEDIFHSKYPNFEQTYMKSMAECLTTGNRVMIDSADIPESIVAALREMCKDRITQEGLALSTLIEHFHHKFTPPEARLFKQVQLSVSRDYVDTIQQFYVLKNKPEWRMYKFMNQVCEQEALDLLKARWDTERKLTASQMSKVVNYLYMSYSEEETKDKLLVEFINVPVHPGKISVMESIPITVRFSRFCSLEPMYDYMLLRSYGCLFPITGTLQDLKTESTCTFHGKDSIVEAASGFGINIEEELLVVGCANFSSFLRITTCDRELQIKMIKNLVSHLEKLSKYDHFFLCMLPLTTRLLLGVICIINKCFEKVTLMMFKEKKVSGILFQNFKGTNSARVQTMIYRLERLVSEIQKNEKVNMEFVSIQSLFNCVNFTNLMLYNDGILEKSIKSLSGFLSNIIFFRKLV